MTERLRTLLRDEADRLDVPPAPTAALLRRGRGLRTRRRIGSGLAAALALALIGGSAAVLLRTFPGEAPSRPDTVDPTMAVYLEGGAYAAGSRVYFGAAGERNVDVRGKVKAIYYTSAGVVVRTGKVPWTDSAGASHYALVTPDGTLRPLSLTLGDVKPGTSPTSPYLAYAMKTSAGYAVHFLDVRTDTEAAPAEVTGRFTWGGWAAPPIALDGDTAYVAMDGAMVTVDRRTGATSTDTHLPGSTYPEVAGGHASIDDGHTVGILDVVSGRTLVAAPPPAAGSGPVDGFFRLSPDGRYALLVVQQELAGRPGRQPTLYDLDTGAEARVRRVSTDIGWTPDGHVLRVTRTTVSVCEPLSGTCDSTPVELAPGTIRIGGNDNES